jgi:hypothetical protein
MLMRYIKRKEKMDKEELLWLILTCADEEETLQDN